MSGTCCFLSALQEKEPPKISKKKLRKLNRLTVAQLKQLVDRPDVVEMHDVTAQDPKLLIHLKVGKRGEGGGRGGGGTVLEKKYIV